MTYKNSLSLATLVVGLSSCLNSISCGEFQKGKVMREDECAKEKICSEKNFVLPNGAVIEANFLGRKNGHLRFCTKEDLGNKSYLVGMVDGIYGAWGPAERIIKITSEYHYEYPVYVEGRSRSMWSWYGFTVGIPIVRSLEESCQDKDAKMYEVINQNDPIDIKEIKVLKNFLDF